MLLRAWSTDLNGTKVNPEDNWEKQVDSRAEATAVLAEDLINTASDNFLDQALASWFKDGKVNAIPESDREDNATFWNVELTAN